MDSHVSVDVMHFCTPSPFFCGQNSDDLIHSAVRNHESAFHFSATSSRDLAQQTHASSGGCSPLLGSKSPVAIDLSTRVTTVILVRVRCPGPRGGRNSWCNATDTRCSFLCSATRGARGALSLCTHHTLIIYVIIKIEIYITFIVFQHTRPECPEFDKCVSMLSNTYMALPSVGFFMSFISVQFLSRLVLS